jgi:ADP-ribosylglycohydrolase
VGFVVKSLEAALWAFHRTSTVAEGAIAAVNLGDDADTTGAIYGQLAGAHYGVGAIPAEWLSTLAQRDVVAGFATRLHAAALR